MFRKMTPLYFDVVHLPRGDAIWLHIRWVNLDSVPERIVKIKPYKSTSTDVMVFNPVPDPG
jgi:hypothetical protein